MTPMHFQSIEISNFRGIRHASFKDFGRINLFLGENNSGKTSVLEALFLTLGISNPKLPPNIERIRGLIYTEGSDFLYLFHRLEAESEPRFEAQMRSAPNEAYPWSLYTTPLSVTGTVRLCKCRRLTISAMTRGKRGAR